MKVSEIISWQQVTCPFPKVPTIINSIQSFPIQDEHGKEIRAKRKSISYVFALLIKLVEKLCCEMYASICKEIIKKVIFWLLIIVIIYYYYFFIIFIIKFQLGFG